MNLEISVAEVKRRRDAGEPVHLIDVREPEEFRIAHIAGAELIPMGTIPAQIQRLEAMADEAPLVVYCHHGIRSLNVADWLRRNGVEALSMAGGIETWSLDIDPSVPRY